MTTMNATGHDRGPEAHAWYDSRQLLDLPQDGAVIDRLFHSSYTGAVLYPDTADRADERIPKRWLRVLQVDEAKQVAKAHDDWVVASDDPSALEQARTRGLPTCLRAAVVDGESLHAAIDNGRAHPYLLLRFKDPTNIPLELVLAELQPTDTVVVKEIADGSEV